MKKTLQIIALLIGITPAYVYYSELADKFQINETQERKDSIVTISISFVGVLCAVYLAQKAVFSLIL